IASRGTTAVAVGAGIDQDVAAFERALRSIPDRLVGGARDAVVAAGGAGACAGRDARIAVFTGIDVAVSAGHHRRLHAAPAGTRVAAGTVAIELALLLGAGIELRAADENEGESGERERFHEGSSNFALTYGPRDDWAEKRSGVELGQI